MRLSAYILAADPAWMEESLLSYYHLVDRIVVSYDEHAVGWTGVEIPVRKCLEILRRLDVDGKMIFSAGCYCNLGLPPMEAETHQRQSALNEASDHGDWVLQLDTDEVMQDAAEFRDCILEAEGAGFQALNFPSRFLYRQIAPDLYLEASSRSRSITAGYPGALAIRAGISLVHARQCGASSYHVDFSERSTDPFRPSDTVVHRVISPDKGVLHFAWVRDEADMIAKSKWSGHARDLDWGTRLMHWKWSGRFPKLAIIAGFFLPSQHTWQLREVRICLRSDCDQTTVQYKQNDS